MKFIPSSCILYSSCQLKTVLKALTLQSLVIIFYRVVKPKKITFYIKNNFSPSVSKVVSGWMNFLFLGKCYWNLKNTLSAVIVIVSIYLWVSSVNFQFSGLFLLPFSSYKPPRLLLCCCIMPLPKHSLQNTCHLHHVSKLQTKRKNAAPSSNLSFNHAAEFSFSEGIEFKWKWSGTHWASCKRQSAANNIKY